MSFREIFWLSYITIGIIYTIINGAVRKLNSDGDWLLPWCWLLLWPVFFLTLFFKLFSILYLKIKNKV